ncbi:MAG: flippase [Candidatus Atribacteria bacterium]|nr:flippase [Candidatus Atribacteria bacterium]
MKIINKIFNKFNFSTNRRKIFSNIYWAVVGKVVNISSGLLVGIFVARYLGPEEYGLMNYVISYVALFSILATFGFDNIEVRELARRSYPKEQILGTALYLRFFFATATILLIIITLLLFEPDHFTFWMIIVYSLSLIFNTFAIIRNYFTSIVFNEYIVKTEITRTIIGALIKIGLLLVKAPLEWFIISSTFDFFIIASGYIYSYRKKVSHIKSWSFKKEIAFYQIKESFPLLLSGAAIIIYQKIDQIMIRSIIDNKAVGQFAVAAKFAEFIIFIPGIIAQTITPLLVQAREENQKLYELKRQQFMDVMVWGAIGLSLATSLSAKIIITVLYGHAYNEAIPVLQIMAWKAAFASFLLVSGQIIIIQNLQRFAVIRNIIGCLVNVILNFVVIPKWGIIGAAWTAIVTFAVAGYFSHLVIKPYREIFKIQTDSILKGYLRIPKILTKKNENEEN